MQRARRALAPSLPACLPACEESAKEQYGLTPTLRRREERRGKQSPIGKRSTAREKGEELLSRLSGKGGAKHEGGRRIKTKGGRGKAGKGTLSLLVSSPSPLDGWRDKSEFLRPFLTPPLYDLTWGDEKKKMKKEAEQQDRPDSFSSLVRSLSRRQAGRQTGREGRPFLHLIFLSLSVASIPPFFPLCPPSSFHLPAQPRQLQE